MEFLVGKMKGFSNEQKSTETPSKHQRESFHRSFQSTRTIRDPPGGLRPISLNVNFGQICKRTRSAAAKTSGSFLTALKFLIVWFSGARWLRLPLQIPKLVSKSEIGPRGAKRRPSEKSKILANLECGNRTFKIFLTFFKKDERRKLFCIASVHQMRPF